MELNKAMTLAVSNPYELLILIRDNKYLFSYFITADIKFTGDFDSWKLIGYSDAGKAEVRVLSSGVYRFTLPISIPYGIPISPIANMIQTVNHGDFEGNFTVAEDREGDVIVNYVLYSDLNGLNLALAKFYEEKRIMDNNFDVLDDLIHKMKVDLGGMFNNPSPNKNQQPQQDLWSTLKDLDSVDLDESDDEEDPPEDVK